MLQHGVPKGHLGLHNQRIYLVPEWNREAGGWSCCGTPSHMLGGRSVFLELWPRGVRRPHSSTHGQSPYSGRLVPAMLVRRVRGYPEK